MGRTQFHGKTILKCHSNVLVEIKSLWSRSLSKNIFGSYYSFNQKSRPLRLRAVACVLDMNKQVSESRNHEYGHISDISNSMKKSSLGKYAFVLFSDSVFYSLFGVGDILDPFLLVLLKKLDVLPEFRGSNFVISFRSTVSPEKLLKCEVLELTTNILNQIL